MKKFPVLAKADPLLIIPAGLILAFGLLSLYSIDPAFARAQLIFALFGGLCFAFVSILNYRWLRHVVLPMLAVIVVLLVGVLLFGKEVGGASRWFVFGSLFFSPAELAKVVLIVFLSVFFARGDSSFGIRKLIISVVPVAILLALVILQPSLGTAVIIGAVWAGMVWAAGIPLRYFFACFLLAGISLPTIWRNMETYQQVRITAFLNPLTDPLGSGYNVIQSVIAVGSGRLLGKGLGMGTQSRLQFLPVRHTDFIFASLTEEWGLLGAGILLLLFGILLWRVLKIALSCRDKAGSLLGIGVFMFLFTQVVINVGMNVGVAPITGLTLPLVSYGGSSLLFTFISLGLVHSVTIHRDI